MLEVRSLSKTYGVGASAYQALHAVDVTIGEGEFFTLLGPSGCGKTTLLRLVAGFEQPTGGQLVLDGRDIAAIPPNQRPVNTVFQNYALFPHLTVAQNVAFGLEAQDRPAAEVKARVAEMLDLVQMAHLRDRRSSALSGGQQQRVALSRSLALNPSVILLDEPLSNLDAKLRLEMRAELKRIHEEAGSTIVFVTHDQWEAMTLATTIAVMSEGRLQQVGTPNAIYDRPVNRFVAQFVGNPPINIVAAEPGEPAGLLRMALAFLDERCPQLGPIGSIGLRPEAIRLSDAANPTPPGALSGEAEVTGILPTGGSWIIELTCAGEKLFLTTHEPPRAELGRRVTFHVKPENLHIFDTAGRRSEAADRMLGQGPVRATAQSEIRKS
jgi:iron(III) transport system ATP-binding protein